jgi:hypothetical protein
MKIENYETRKGKSRHIEVKIVCEECGKETWAKWTRVKKGQGRFCSLTCANKFQCRRLRKNFGKDNASFIWDGICWRAYWKDEETGKQINTTKAKWLWEREHGEVPDRHVVTYIDGNSKNCELNNLKLITRSESNSIHLMGHKVSDETKRKLSTTHTGKTLTEEHKQRIGEGTKRLWKKGIFDTPRIRAIYSKQGRSTKGSKRTEEMRRKMSLSHLRFYEDPDNYNKKLKTYKRGSEHYNWRGGASEERYPAEFSRRLRRQIRERDHQLCRICGATAKGIQGNVHHIDADKNNNDESNLILVCRSCHGKIHGALPISDPVIMAFRSLLDYRGVL